jgi:type VI secretion system protein VasD
MTRDNANASHVGASVKDGNTKPSARASARNAALRASARRAKLKASPRSHMRVAVTLLSALVLTACASKPPKAVATRAQLVVSTDVNPDASGRPSPIVVRLFQLKADGEFTAADFFALYEREKETLATTLVAREEYVLTPGETRKLDLALNPEARFIGAVAAYRDIRGAHWRALTQAPEKTLTDLIGKDGVTLNVGKDTVTLAVKD